ncbi:hypothetical protein BDQ12DRAFT_299349 [Crucibulum laeve]|uniref:PIN domain-containing protein n=1 Tax=Crucibulum laeve TaxID=68775 RepID=A0A5C3MP08_9AGAR|nr:hypothetical protein BDQ12DRAFT_299349 [Crucibulum laeve]
MHDSQLLTATKKGKERDSSQLREQGPQPTDIDSRLTALRRKQAGAIRPRDRPERERMQVASPQHPLPPPSRIDRSPRTGTGAVAPSTSRQSPSSPRKPHVVVSRPTIDADHEDFSRRLKISSSPTPRQASASTRGAQSGGASKLFNPDTDPIPLRRTAEPDAISDANSHAQRGTTGSRADDRGGASARQLFDHRKDDPVRFSVLARPQGRPQPTSKPSADYISASSTSSYAPSIASSSFTLSSTTDGSSASSALFDGRPGNQEESSNNVFSVQLKKLYRNITALETKIKTEDSIDDNDNESRVLIKGKEIENEDLAKEKWKKQITDHKELAEVIHTLLEISLAPSVPASLRNIPTKYNMIVRLWTYAFHKLLESLRRASFSSPLALEHLQDFIYYAYTFYTGLLEEPTLDSFKSGWLEALGDLARYRMAVAAMVNAGQGGQSGLTAKALSEVPVVVDESGLKPPAVNGPKSVSDAPAARIDDSPSPSVGVAAARLLDVEPEKERWRGIARDWYGAGLAEQPGTGKLHHHLGLLSREVEGEDLRGVYHFVKSMTTLHPFPTSRESVLPIWSHAAQARRSLPDARASDLFVFMHGMLFTNIQLDDFTPTLARFIERLEIEGAEEREWIMMGVTNIGAVLEYGRPSGVLRKVGGAGARDVVGTAQAAAAMRVMAKKAAAGVGEPVGSGERMDVDEVSEMASPPMSEVEPEVPEHPPAFKYALQLTFAMLSYVLRHPTRKASQYARSTLNPYLTVLLTFLATVLKHQQTLEILQRSIPWEELAAFFATVPRKIMTSQKLLSSSKPGEERWPMLTSGCAPPLPEDWCLRGMEWVGRKVFERGFWKSGEERRAELEVLEEGEGGEVTDGQIEDDDGDDDSGADSSYGSAGLGRRWVRIVRCGVGMSGVVDGFTWVECSREWKVEGKLKEKVEAWREQDQLEREEEERRMGRRWADDPMDVDEDEGERFSEEDESEDDENDSEEVKALKARRRYLKSLLQSGQREVSSGAPVRRSRASRKPVDNRLPLPIVPGYTVLVIDTNILLSSLPMIASVIESLRWTVLVPLPVIMELDGLSSSSSAQLAEAAQSAMAYLSSHLRSHAISLKVQTSKGNYLTSLNVRTEEVDFSGDGNNAERTMDDLILRAAIWQDEHWVDRSGLLKSEAADTHNAVKVVLLSLDRNLRLKARSRQLPAASEKDLASILATGT